MRSSLFLGIALLLTIAHIAQARKLGCSTCGGSIASGTNPCKCAGDVVVKAAKVQKPLYHATPEAINEAAVAREVADLFAPFSQYGQTSGLHGVSGNSYSSSSSSSASSSVDVFGGSVVGGSSFYPFSSRPTHNSGCGCGSNSKASLELNDLLLTNADGNIVPRFSPIGDMCSPTQEKTSNLEVSTTVTPAYPKLQFRPPSVTSLCLDVVNGQVDQAELEKLAATTSYSESVWDSPKSYGLGYTGSFGGQSNALAGSSSWYRPANALGLGRTTQSYAASSAGSLGPSSGTSTFDGYGASYDGFNTQGSIGRSSGCTDFGDEFDLPEDYSYPRQPADAVSLTLAYKNLFPHTAVYNQQKWFVPEDKLAFGHRTVPTESFPTKKSSDIPEEKLQILDKPIVELKPVAPVVLNIGSYNEQEEAKLAELEAIERERIYQEETASQPQGSFITYGDLGYAPVDGLLVPGNILRPGAQVNSGVGLNGVEEAFDEGCLRSVGPPVPGYVPGSVTINREVVEVEREDDQDSRRNNGAYFRHYLDDVSDEDDDIEDTSGIFTRLRSSAHVYGPVTCPR